MHEHNFCRWKVGLTLAKLCHVWGSELDEYNRLYDAATLADQKLRSSPLEPTLPDVLRLGEVEDALVTVIEELASAKREIKRLREEQVARWGATGRDGYGGASNPPADTDVLTNHVLRPD